MVKKLLRWFGFVPSEGYIYAPDFMWEAAEKASLERAISEMVDENLKLAKSNDAMEDRINCMNIVLDEKESKIESQKKLLTYFHKDRENISKTRRENEELRQRVKVQRENIDRLIAANEGSGELIESLKNQLENQCALHSRIYHLERRVALSKMQRRSYRANDRYLKKQLKVAYSKGYEDGKDDGLLEGYIE